MAAGGFCKLPDGNVVVALNLPGRTTRGVDAARPVAAPSAASGAVPGALGAPRSSEVSGVPGGLSRAGTVPAASGSPGLPGVPGAAQVSGVPGASRAPGVPEVPGAQGAAPDEGFVRVLVLAANRARALTRLRNLGLRAIYLRGNAAPPTPDEITAVLHHPDGLIWRTSPPSSASTAPELWHPIRALLRKPPARV
ncbi:hypothetical protein Sipo8835_46505 [Streptomyces ipomoeae]|uniref:Uncharacterized protein n=1 Tax=Streptomyces ipomoeae TaxID=103232 RepID=A0AAE8VSR6_9ACTN|nr:hypothetical protein Sipo8835_46505 [Streptomyces ipomoeae]TQE32028.1 hypothetical protein Sipo7851_24650 [Streptomyces ipomoeae]